MSNKAQQRAADVAQMEREKQTEDFTPVWIPRPGRPKGSQNKNSGRSGYQPEAVGTFASGTILGAVLKYDGDYLMVVPNPEFPTVVKMDIDTAAFRINLCTEHRIFDADLTAKINALRGKSATD
jgi:hypothetical protein